MINALQAREISEAVFKSKNIQKEIERENEMRTSLSLSYFYMVEEEIEKAVKNGKRCVFFECPFENIYEYLIEQGYAVVRTGIGDDTFLTIIL